MLLIKMSYTEAVLGVEVQADASMCKSGVKMVAGVLLLADDM